MRPAARLQSAIELVDQIILAARDGGASADQIAKRFFAERRYAGSKDRRAVRDLAWGVIRRFGKRPATARSAFAAMADVDPELAALFDGSDYGPAVMDPTEARSTGGALPKWIKPLFSILVDEAEQASLLDRAPMDLRVNALKASRAEVSEMFPEAEIMVTGVEEPDSRAHSPNESQHLPTLKRAMTAEALLLLHGNQLARD